MGGWEKRSYLVVRREVLMLAEGCHRLLELLLQGSRGGVVGRRPEGPFNAIVRRGEGPGHFHLERRKVGGWVGKREERSFIGRWKDE